MTLLTANRAEDFELLNTPGQGFNIYVAFGNEIKIAVDGNMQSPPPTIFAENVNLVPFRPTAVMGSHRIGFVGEGLPFYGGCSYTRFRQAAINHSWSGTGDPTIEVVADTHQTYPDDVEHLAIAQFTWDAPGIYEVHLTVTDFVTDNTHTGTRQVIIYPSRESAYDGVVEISGLGGAIDQGGWSCQLRVKNNLDFLLNAQDLEGYIPVVIYVDTLYETSYGVWERKEFGPLWHSDFLCEDPRILFSGYIVNGTIEVSEQTSTVTFDCRTSDFMLEQMQSGTYGFFESAFDGSGIIFNDLQTHDVIRHMVQEHSNWADWNDIRLFYNIYDDDSENNVGSPGMEYKDWTFNQGMFLSNIKDTADNQFERGYCDRTGAFHVYPDRNMYDAAVFRRNSDSTLAALEAEEEPIGVIAVSRIDGQNVIIPMQPIRITERLSAAVSYYKIIASLSFYNEEWGADYPRGAPAPASGRWVLIQGKYYSDQNRTDSWNNLWYFTTRGYAAANARYGLSLAFGMNTYFRPGDVYQFVYADPQGRINFQLPGEGQPENYFEIESINYEIALEPRQWRTSITLRLLTSYTAPTPDIPAVPPQGQGSS